MNNLNNYLSSVRDQYEELPYPARNPEDEKTRLVTTWLDDLPMINHYCFAGKQDFEGGFRALVAGGGTGDGTIYLAEQLRNSSAEIVHADMSEASIAIAKKRAEIRGLPNIKWVHASLLNLETLGLGHFDYINCVGVLHHLADPDAGLKALRALLKPDGAMGIMVYGQYGRTGVYQMQTLLRVLNQDHEPSQIKIQRARDIMVTAPAANWFKRGQSLYVSDKANDAEIFDLLLHSQDRAYSVPQLYEWLVDNHGLHIHFTDTGRGGYVYMPRMVAGSKNLEYLDRADSLPLRKQHEVAEILGGSIIGHTFYLTHEANTESPYGDPDYVPAFVHEPLSGPELAKFVEGERNRKNPITVNHVHTGVTAEVVVGAFSKYILNNIDGHLSFGQIFQKIRSIDKFKKAHPTDEQLFDDFKGLYDLFRAIDRILLHHKSTTCPSGS